MSPVQLDEKDLARIVQPLRQPFIAQKSGDLNSIPEYIPNQNIFDEHQALIMLQDSKGSNNQTGTLQLTSNVAPGQNDTTSLQQTNTQNMMTITQIVSEAQHYGVKPAGATLQEQISKQYSPISRRLESMGHISHFSKSNEDELMKTAGYVKNAKSSAKAYGLPQAIKIVKEVERLERSLEEMESDEMIENRVGFGLTSIEDQQDNIEQGESSNTSDLK